MSVSRRTFLEATPFVLAPAIWPQASVPSAPLPPSSSLSSTFPTQSPDLAREMVAVSHSNIGRVKELLALHPTLSRASWDWGFGDWEDALGAASHVGNREIDTVKAFIAASPGIEATPGPHGITLLRHAMAGGPASESVVEYLKTLPLADRRPETQPIAPEGLAALAGDYVYGTGPDERIIIAVTANGVLTFTRAKGSARNLFHVGDRAFFPVGAPLVRIKFRETSGGMSLTVHDPGLIVEAKRTSGVVLGFRSDHA